MKSSAVNKQKAWNYWLDAAEQGHSDRFRSCQTVADAGYARGQFILGYFYQQGIGTPADIQTALRLFHLSAEQGNSDGIERLGECYAGGTGVPMDNNIACRYFQLAAGMGNMKGQCCLGLCYLNGTGCRQDTELGFRWIMRTVDSCHPVVIQILQQAGLDVGKLSGGYRQFRQ